MQGNNELKLSPAAMIEAVETYLNEHVLVIPTKVTNVTQEDRGAGPGCFKVEMTRQDKSAKVPLQLQD